MHVCSFHSSYSSNVLMTMSLMIMIMMAYQHSAQPANTSLKDYGRFQKDGELKVLSHMDSRVRNRYVLPPCQPSWLLRLDRCSGYCCWCCHLHEYWCVVCWCCVNWWGHVTVTVCLLVSSLLSFFFSFFYPVLFSCVCTTSVLGEFGVLSKKILQGSFSLFFFFFFFFGVLLSFFYPVLFSCVCTTSVLGDFCVWLKKFLDESFSPFFFFFFLSFIQFSFLVFVRHLCWRVCCLSRKFLSKPFSLFFFCCCCCSCI